ncbi:MAG: symmetrical bis(5'-nucleosyl)-tetraphosphatase [Myxococcota bacterium]|nr:symmetrical bis(5'-nucleosyl)-tetraphosphatase [Myxococcota bacterium]
MATYVIGDIQGCYDELQALLAEISFDPDVDRIWLVGDLVNRGPQSLEVLRWARGLGDRVTCVLGNHDMHVLARGVGAVAERPRETFGSVMSAPDKDELVDWLRTRPLVHREGDLLMVHAGFHPSWTAEEALAIGDEVSRALQGPEIMELLSTYRPGPFPWSDELTGVDRLAAAIAYLTRVRCVDDNDVMDESFSDGLEDVPQGLNPWWARRAWRPGEPVTLFGHWAALGVHRHPGYIALDSGCVWGNPLSALRLEDDRLFQVPGWVKTAP